MDEKFEGIEMVEFERSECKPENPIKVIFEDNDNFNFTVKLSQKVPKEWADTFKMELSKGNDNLRMKTRIYDDKLSINNVPFSSFKDIAQRYKDGIKRANSEHKILFTKQNAKNADIQKKLDDLEAEIFKKRPVELKVRVL